MEGLLLQCRQGYEQDAAAEIIARLEALQVYGYVKTQPEQAYVIFIAQEPERLWANVKRLNFKQLIFTRQIFYLLDYLDDLPQTNRISPMLSRWQKTRWGRAADIFVEHPDTEQDKTLSAFCRKFTVPLRQALKKEALLDAASPWRLHAFFLDSRRVYLGVAWVAQSSPDVQGIARLKMPSDAPSRSTLKLEEALRLFVPASEQAERLKEGLLAVDLGACPGGWTYQMVRRGLHVFAVDHGKIAENLMKSGQVMHCVEDGFKFTPPPHHPIHWLLCDMLERPQRVMPLMIEWLQQQRCREAVFNLKLPMKKRFALVSECLADLERALKTSGLDYRWQGKQLYHDRDEITLHVQLL